MKGDWYVLKLTSLAANERYWCLLRLPILKQWFRGSFMNVPDEFRIIAASERDANLYPVSGSFMFCISIVFDSLFGIHAPPQLCLQCSLAKEGETSNVRTFSSRIKNTEWNVVQLNILTDIGKILKTSLFIQRLLVLINVLYANTLHENGLNICILAYDDRTAHVV